MKCIHRTGHAGKHQTSELEPKKIDFRVADRHKT